MILIVMIEITIFKEMSKLDRQIKRIYNFYSISYQLNHFYLLNSCLLVRYQGGEEVKEVLDVINPGTGKPKENVKNVTCL